ncbi:MAG: endonuclease/exonuclease/phosphatase family protein [Flavobacterium sp.]
MRFSKFIMTFFFVFGNFNLIAQQKIYELHTVAFYNFENLFDTINQPNYDDEWTPNGKQRWTSDKYSQKLKNISKVVSQIGINEQQKQSPTFIGAAEVENKQVLEDLIKEPLMVRQNYGIVHFDSPDKRGIDVALLYRKNHFKPTSYKNIPLLIYRKSDEVMVKNVDQEQEIVRNRRVYTRDILLVTGLLENEEIHLLVNHWPSRSGGEKKSRPFRERAGKLTRKIMDSLYSLNPNAKIICMGDFNDTPDDKSIKNGIESKRNKSEVTALGIYNPFEQMAKEGNATLFYRDVGSIFDQIMVSEPMIRSNFQGWSYWKSGIWNKSFMIQSEGKFKGYPLRHSENEVGFSDHFPVYIYLISERK